MTGIVKKIGAPVDAKDQLHLSDRAYKQFTRKVAGETFRVFFILVSIVAMVALLTLNLVQLRYINSSLDKLDRNYVLDVANTDQINEISVLAAYCAKLPESTTVASTQTCIENNMKEKPKK